MKDKGLVDMEKVIISLEDGKQKEFPKNTSYYEISKSFALNKNVLGVKINNEIFSLTDTASNNETIAFIDENDLIGNKIYASGLKFLFEVALKKAFPNLDITYQHSVPKGILGEVVGDKILSQEDLSKIKNIMANLIEDDLPFKKYTVKKKDAIKFYRWLKQDEKNENIQNISDVAITLYGLDGYYNYFYNEMPYSTGSITKYDIVYLGRNRLVFLIPNYRGNGEIPEYVHYDNIINSFLVGKNWLETLKMPYVSSINNKVAKDKIRDFIKACELMFNLDITNTVNEIKNKRDIKFILIAGPSSSGKTTTSKRLRTYLEASGFDPINLSTDDFFVEREETPKNEKGEYDFECLSAIDLNLFNTTLKSLLAGERVSIPTFNFISGKKEYNDNYIELKDNSIIIIEGLHALNDELLSGIENKYKYKIYLSPFIPLNIDRHNYISTTDLRLIRRIIRDNRTRGYDVNHTIHAWQNVRNGEEKYIFPYIHQADKIINTALTYEIGVEKVYIEPLLRSIRVDSDYYEEARRLLDFLKIFYTIPSEYVNEDSILREFIGGCND